MESKPIMAVFLTSVLLALAWGIGSTNVIAQGPAPLSGRDVAHRVDRILTAHNENGMFDGAVLLAMNGKVIFKNAYGLADHNSKLPNATDTRFCTASLGKSLTAHLVLKLVEEGRLALDRPIDAYLPGLDKRIAKKVTIHHLLTHSSGLSWWARSHPDYQTKGYTLDQLVRLAEGLELQFEPGTRTLYSNSGYNLLAAIIERVTGERFVEVMGKRILEPAGMRDTGFAWVDNINRPRAIGYDRVPGGEYVPALPNEQSYAIGAGGMYSTVQDMFRWTTFMDRDLSAESRERMFTPHLPQTGYGWGISRYGTKSGNGGKYALGLGGTNGFSSVQSRCLDDDHYMIILSNVRQLDQSRIANDLLNTMLGFDVDVPTRSGRDAFFQKVLEGGSEATLARYRQQLREGGSNLPDESAINVAGYAYLPHHRFDEAIALFRFNVSAYPQSWNAFDSLSEAYEMAGLEQLATENARKSLKLNPNNDASAQRIERLKR